MKIYLVRHTTPAVPKGVCYGVTDVEIAETFPQEAAMIKPLLPAADLPVYTSPLLVLPLASIVPYAAVSPTTSPAAGHTEA